MTEVEVSQLAQMPVLAIPSPRLEIGPKSRKTAGEIVVHDEREVRDVSADFVVEIGFGARPVRGEEPVRAVVWQIHRARLDRPQLVFDRLDDRGDPSRRVERGEVVLGQPEWRTPLGIPDEYDDSLACDSAKLT